MPRKGINKKANGRVKQTDGRGAVSQPLSHKLSAVRQEGGGKGGDVSGVEEDKREKSIIDLVHGQTIASGTSSHRSQTPPLENLHQRKGGSRRRPPSDTQQSMVDISFFILHDIPFNPVQSAV